MKQIVTSAIVLKRMNYSEADRIITVVTSGYGKVSILAKGVRRAKSKLAGGLELFSVTELTYIDGKSNLKTVASTRLKVHYKNIVSDMQRTTYAYDFLKLIDTLSQDDCGPEYFQILDKGLSCLNDTAVAPDISFIWFVQQLSMLTGSSMNLESPLEQQSFKEDDQYQFSLDDMSFFAHKNGIYSPHHIKFLRLSQQVTTPLILQSVTDAVELSQELQPLVKQTLAFIQQG